MFLQDCISMTVKFKNAGKSMDIDDEPSPAQLEQLLSAWTDEANHGRGDGYCYHQGETTYQRLDTGEKCTSETGHFSTELKHLLALVPGDDPLIQSTHRQPCLPRLEGEYLPTSHCCLLSTAHAT